MTSQLAPHSLTRRYAWLSFLQWLPVGLTIVPLVLLLLDRGFDLGQVAALGAVSAVTVGVLELPTGGLADVVGRRPVLILSALTHAIALLLLGLAASLTLLVLSAALRGLARALSSGPLEAWYVDAVQSSGTRPAGDDAYLTTGLARGEFAASSALAVGTVGGGLLPVLVSDLAMPVPGLAVPVLLGAGVEMVRLGVTAGIEDPARAPGTWRSAVRTVRVTVGSGLRLAGRDALILRLLVVGAAAGIALGVIELVTPGWLGRLAASPEWAALAYALLATAGFAADALGATLAPAARRRLRTPARAAAAATAVALGGALGLMAAPGLGGLGALLMAGTAYVAVFLGLGVAGPPLGELLHGQVAASERATVLSMQSLVFQIAGAGGALVAGWLTLRGGSAAGFAVAAASMACALAMLAATPTGGSGRLRSGGQ